LKDIHDELAEEACKSNENIILPEFPGRKLFGSTNKSEEAVLKRQQALLHVIINLIEVP
jgi:hypothetical protein